LSALAGTARAIGDLGDNLVDPSLIGTMTEVVCPPICVPKIEDCPDDDLPANVCPGDTTICPDGTCAILCDEAQLVSPCLNECAPVACPRAIDTHKNCLTRFGYAYDFYTHCSRPGHEHDVFPNVSPDEASSADCPSAAAALMGVLAGALLVGW